LLKTLFDEAQKDGFELDFDLNDSRWLVGLVVRYA
jgi:hypothetical protein